MSLILYAGLQYICSEARAGRYWGENSFPTRNLGMILGYDFAIFLHNAIEKLCSILFC